MNTIDLDRLEHLHQAATPGPWFVRHLDDTHAMSAVAVSTQVDTGAGESMRAGLWPGQEIVAACLLQAPPYVVPTDERWDENAALIAEVRTVLPTLIRLARIGLAHETSSGT